MLPYGRTWLLAIGRHLKADYDATAEPSRGESDMLLRNSNTGGLEVYDIANNQLTGAAFIGNVGVDWQFGM